MSDHKTLMDALDAPQWTDFTSSPQVSDDFFNRLHLEHELDYHEKLKECPDMLMMTAAETSDFKNVLDDVQITPIKVISPKQKNKDEKPKETTVENILLEAMSNLQLSGKKGRINHSTANGSIEVFKTPNMTSKSITRSMSAREKIEKQDASCIPPNTENKIELEMKKDSQILTTDNDSLKRIENKEKILHDKSDISKEKINSAKKIPSRIVTSFANQASSQHIIKKGMKPEGRNICEIQSPESRASQGKSELKIQEGKENDAGNTCKINEKSIPSRIITSFSSQKTHDSVNSNENLSLKKRPHLVTSIRRHSLSKIKHKDQFVSLAEAISKFQKGTPKRFHTISAKDAKPAPLLALKQASRKMTHPKSPILKSKTRVRPIKAIHPVGSEKLESLKVGARTGKMNSGLAASVSQNSDKKKKSLTSSENLNSSKLRKLQNFSSSESLSAGQSSNLHDASHHKEQLPIQKKFVHTIVSTDDANLAVKEVELGHFGIPTEPCGKQKKFTRTLPFSFEIRNKELQEKKDRRLKQMQQSEEMKKAKVNFHLNPAPNVIKESEVPLATTRGKMSPRILKESLSSATKKTTPVPFSFEERDKLLMKKRENIMKESLEKDKKAREFHANPVPEFRPVIVRGRSRENLKLQNEKSPDILKIKKSLFPVTKSCPANLKKSNTANQENVKPNDNVGYSRVRPASESDINGGKLHLKTGKKSAIPVELNTDKRAKERKDYYEKLKRKELEEEALRKKEEEERLAREKAEIFEIRKMAEHKARPMPHYKPITIIKSTKPLTDPQSPAFAHKFKK